MKQLIDGFTEQTGARPPGYFFQNQPRVMHVALFCSLLVSLIILLLTPFDLGDSDLWFHLNQGRQFFRQGAIPSTSFFSYIEPLRHWTNYAWLFQALTYQIFSHTGYAGLLFLRSLVYVLLGFMIFCVLNRDKNANIVAVSVAMLCFVSVMLRSTMVRPHIFTYLFIVITLYIFEKKKKFWLLPVVFLLQANLHGIAYPFLLIILGSYFAEYYVQYKLNKPLDVTRKQLLLALLAPLFLFLTPHGYHLIFLPFDNAASFVPYYIMEMAPPSFNSSVAFALWPFVPLLGSMLRFFALAALLGALYLLYKRKLRVSHAALVCAGIFFYCHSIRFQYEWLFYSLPVLAALVHCVPRFSGKHALLAGVVLIFCIPVASFGYILSQSDLYPFSFKTAPIVGTRFIRQLPKGQTVLTAPSKAGYLAWELFPRHKIFMDLELALFDDAAAYEVAHIFSNPVVLQQHIQVYHPSVIYLPLHIKKQEEFKAALEDYRPVFFDDFGIVFVRPDIAAGLPALTFLDTIFSQKIDKKQFSKKEQAQLVTQLERIVSFDKQNFSAYVLLANAYLEFGLPDKTLALAGNLIDNFPQQIAGYVLKAQALVLLGKAEDSIAYFKQAMTKQGTFDRGQLGKNYYVALASLQRFKEAYDVLKNAYNPFGGSTPYDILYEFAIGAVNAGENQEAALFIKIALLTVPEFDMARKKELLQLRDVLREQTSGDNT